MHETKDPAIKLFGQKIPFPGEPDAPPLAHAAQTPSPAMDIDGEDDFAESDPEHEKDQDPGDETDSEKTKEADPPPNGSAEFIKTPEGIQNAKTPSTDEETAKTKIENKSENDQNKTLKKPDKILPCPRCNSMDTKFCYYNNYNVNQPRYFCKACQRYWTAGGTMRNVPVGAGRRKNKNSASHYRHITISEALQAARIDSSNVATLKPNGRVLSFGLDPPICDSMASVLNLTENKTRNTFQNHNHNHNVEDQRNKKEDDCSSASTITVSNEEIVRTTSQDSIVVPNGFIPHVPCVPWPYPWNNALCPPGFPMSFYPAAAFWNIPWFPSHSHHSTGPNSPTLGKHSRDEDVAKENKEEPTRQRNGSSVLVPKTLRIDDPSEAAKSSIWATLGIKNECVSVSGGGMFKGFQSKKDDKNHVVEASPVLRANPAALSRSLNFHENS
ncbi:hypothetical protein Fmac_008701 [Flemingia macrophylla]|uniref:Dof-type domain-containing protein n=1 Tax=Flemingia macrophylla TaxID=520843 RepID=A0ABD1MY52_9FABA